MVARQLVFYFVFGCTQFALDTALLVLLTHAGVPVALANLLSRATAAVLGLLLNASITFKSVGQPGLKSATVVRFAVMWVSITLLSTLLVTTLHEMRPDSVERAVWIAVTKIGVEGVLFLLSFMISRHWVYRTSAP